MNLYFSENFSLFPSTSEVPSSNSEKYAFDTWYEDQAKQINRLDA
jgi:hypothetical protein